MFKFTFSLGSSVLPNPFAALTEERERIQQAVAPQTIKRKLPAPPRRPSPPLPTADEGPRSRKRGWVPTSRSASEATSQPTLTNGWIDTPAKYIEQASLARGEDADGDAPPAKRRRTLADSIISTAFSAALIGTAVGLTAYRMWRDRGRSAEESASSHMPEPPPPYQRDEWVDDMPTNRTPRTHKKSRTVARRVPRQRRAHVTTSPAPSPAHVLSPSSFMSTGQEEIRIDQGDIEDKMDSMGDKIRRLIEEGQKALGKEVVIQTDGQNDEEEGAIDDGMEGWEEENQGSYPTGPSSVTSSNRSYPRRNPPKSPAINYSVSCTTPRGRAFPASFTTFPGPTQSRSAAGGSRSRSPPASVFPYLHTPSEHKLDSRSSHEDAVKDFYKPAGSVRVSHFDDALPLEDEDSRRLTQRLEAVRKTYNIH